MQGLLIQNLDPATEPWATIFDASHNGIVVIDRDGFVLVYNHAARRIFNETGRYFVGQHFSKIRPETWPDLQEILKTGRPQIGKRIDLPQASIVANRTPIVIDNEVVGVVSVFQDISEYEKIITVLQGFQKLHARLEAVIESSHDGLVLSDQSGVILMQKQSAF
jgi:sensor histidine kinase regulating citrate/malate metabolism